MCIRDSAAAARADDGDELAVAHGEALDVEHRQAAAVLAEALADAGRFERDTRQLLLRHDRPPVSGEVELDAREAQLLLEEERVPGELRQINRRRRLGHGAGLA